jgi:hypothetical protein
MNKPNFIFKIFLFLFALSAANVFAQSDNRQTQADPSYEVILQLLVASNNPSEKSSLPPMLSNTVKKLKNLYTFSDYRLTTTLLQRTSSYLEYKSLLTEFNQIADKNYPAFSEWNLKGIRNLPNSQGKNILQFESFRFGMRIPIIRNVADENGKTSASVIYDATGITTTRLNLNENEPTVVGSLTTSKPDELMFLVLTVRSVE